MTAVSVRKIFCRMQKFWAPLISEPCEISDFEENYYGAGAGNANDSTTTSSINFLSRKELDLHPF